MKKLLIGVLSAFLCTSVHVREAITDYHADITIRKDGWLDVTERIQVHAEGSSIRKGIYRDFPLCYKSDFSWFKTPFSLTSIKRNGNSLSKWDREYLSRGIRIYMRDGAWLKYGPHVFEFSYTVGRHIGFFKDSDELYWNVVGGDWIFPIYASSATVHLPKNVTADQIKYTAYAGSQNSREQAFTAKIKDAHTIEFFCTKQLKPYQAFSIVIGMPKGSIVPPSFFQKLWWNFYDHLGWIFLLIATISFIFYGWYLYNFSQKDDPKKAIIPLFEPPQNFTPGMVNYFVKRDFKTEGFAADLVNMGVQQYIGIDLKKGFFSYFSKTYELELKATPEQEPYSRMLKKLFGSKKKITLNRSQAKEIKKSFEYAKDYCTDQVDGYLLSGYFVVPLIITLFVFLLGIGLAIATHSPEAFYFALPGVLGLFIIVYYTRSYTIKGFEIRDHIAGFKLYLEATEVPRFKYIGTPPERTPELYEKYLPYAMALGVEKQWTKSFATVFERLAHAGRPYNPLWYHHHGVFSSSDFSSGSFASNLNSSLSSSINSSAPGTSSGFGGGSGGGGAGGGGGGGGGGGC